MIPRSKLFWQSGALASTKDSRKSQKSGQGHLSKTQTKPLSSLNATSKEK